MSARSLPPRPDLDHLKREAKALRRAFLDGDAGARDRIAAVLGDRAALKLTEAQRVLAREYGFPTWRALRAHVRSAGGVAAAVDAFLSSVASGDAAGAMRVLAAEPAIAEASIHVAAVLGDAVSVRRMLDDDPSRHAARAGAFDAEPLLWLCHSPLHGESPERDRGLADTARALLDAGADPNARDGRYGVPALYGVTGVHDAPLIATLLLDAGAAVNDGESVFHAAERFHVAALELLHERGVDLNEVGDWGNTPLYFLLRYWDVASEPTVLRGMEWLLIHGADPDVRCGKERETSLHVAARMGQAPTVVGRLLEHGADVHAARGDGRTAWTLARRGGHEELVALLEDAGAAPEALSAADRFLAACGRGDADAAKALASTSVLDALDAADLARLPRAAARGRADVIAASIAAGWPVDARDEQGATALHHAAIHGRAALVSTLLAHGADVAIRDDEHGSGPLGWALFGVDFVADPEGDYEEAVRALLGAGARMDAPEQTPTHAGIRALLAEAGMLE